MNELTISKELAGLEKSKARQIEAVFAPMVKMLKEFEATYDEIAALEMNPDTCAKAKRLRLDIAKVRIGADKVRKEQKEEYLRAGNAIQGVFNILKFAVADKEEKLKEIETHYERIEEEKKKRLQAERELELVKYGVGDSALALGAMNDLVWDNFLSGAKSNYENAREAERKDEADRIEQEKKTILFDERTKALLVYGDLYERNQLTIDSTEEEYENILFAVKGLKIAKDKQQAEIRAENERLKEEAAEATKVKAEIARKVEKARQAEQKKQDAKLKAEREKAEKERIRAEAEKRIQDEIIRKEREAKEKLEREIADREAAAAISKVKERKRIDEEKQKVALSSDKEKLTIIATDVLVKIGTVTSTAAKKAIQAAHDIILNTAERM